MSQSKRSKATRWQRWREQVARLIAMATEEAAETDGCEMCQLYDAGEQCTTCGGSGRVIDAHTRAVLAGRAFDVAKAREYGKRLVAFERHAGVEFVVGDWRQSKGLGPRQCRITDTTATPAREYTIWQEPPGLPPGLVHDAMRWRQHVRLGRRLLAALEGQPSECQRCEGVEQWAKVHPSVEPLHRDHAGRLLGCPDCRGTGHNLAGVLPPVAYPAVAIAKAMDGYRVPDLEDEPAADSPRGRTRAAQREVMSARLLTDSRNSERLADTRVVPRGQHRNLDGHRDSDAFMSGGWTLPAKGDLQPDEHLPRWRRGEIKHAEQRRRRRWANASTAQVYDESAGLVQEMFDQQGAAAALALTRRPDESAAEFRTRVLEQIRTNRRGDALDDFRVWARQAGADWAEAATNDTDPSVPPLTVRIRYIGHTGPDVLRAYLQERAPAAIAVEVDQMAGGHDEIREALEYVADNLRPEIRQAVEHGRSLILTLDDGADVGGG